MALSNAINGTVKQTLFSGSGTWTPDPRMKFSKMYLWNGGSGGGSGRCGASNAAGGGAGGGGGDFCIYDILASNLQLSSYTVTVGAGANGGLSINATTTNGNPGSQGGVSSVGVIRVPLPAVLVGGGTGGASGAATAGNGVSYNNSLAASNYQATGGAGAAGQGNAGVSTNLIWATGGGSGVGYTTTTARTGNAGGSILNGDGSTVLVAGGLGGANTGALAGNGNIPGTFEVIIGGTGGGGGGHDATTIAGSGGNGAVPGGGGGGGAGNLSLNASGAGGNGANGQIIIVEFLF